MATFKRPNVLVLYTDQQRVETLGCYGNPIAKTPNIDALAMEGALFKNFFINSPVCMSSRACFLSGRYSSSHGVGTNGVTVPENLMTINKIMKPYGYHTAQLGKLHFLPHIFRDHRDVHPDYGFDTIIISDEPGCYDDSYIKWVEMIDPEQIPKVRTSLPSPARRLKAAGVGRQPSYSEVKRHTHTPYVFEGREDLTHTAFVTDLALNYLESRKNHTEPFFCIVGFYAPHAPLNPPQRFIDMYRLKDMPTPCKAPHEKWAQEEFEKMSEDDWRGVWQHYLALTSHIDESVGKIIQKLKEIGKYEETIIVFTSDHGEHMGDHGRIQKGMPGYDCIINVPFIISYPKAIKPGQVLEQLCESVDFVPTILDYCGIQIPPFIQGSSLKPLLEGRINEFKEEILVEMFEPFGKKETTIRTKRYKYYFSSDGEELLFDLVNDPLEFNDLSKDIRYKDILSDMRRRMIARIQQAAYPNLEKIFEV